MKKTFEEYRILDDEDVKLLLHMTGSEHRKQMQGYRNFGSFSPGSRDHSRIKRLGQIKVAKICGYRWGNEFWSVTRLGCVLIGMTQAGLKRALTAG